ncbi:MAG TPA: hypothetical protein VGS97_28635 [Actinocrinis sp.]|uniref:hypothetical protein n=1 Tax=Actinocrinis sp. TaxID=1920516 RepID=UPI002DDC9585|nr:hypothetical protein [Actinocrinis sp.]HEV2348088.1 hypothetical protein [Actinocrinis sp.]
MPGDHAGGIVASVATQGRDARGDRVTVDERVGARIYLRVAGPLHPALTITGLRASYQGSANPLGAGRITVDYTVRNTGNVQLSASQLLRASNPFGSYSPARAPADLPLLLPGGSAAFTEEFDHVPPGGLTHVTVSLTAHAAAGQRDLTLPSVRSGTSLWTMPWVALATTACVVAGSVAWALRRRRRRTGPRQNA